MGYALAALTPVFLRTVAGTRALNTPALQFPYMVWAQESGALSPYCLSQSGMPPPSGSFAEGLGIDLDMPSVEARPALEAQLAALFGVDPERVIVSAGASAAMLSVALRFFRPGARVLSEAPSYEPLRVLPTYLGAQRKILPRRMEEGWTLDVELAEKLIAGAPGPVHAFVTNPNNPTGALLERERLRALAAACERAGGILACCEVYMEYLPNARRVHAFELAPNGLSIGSLTKAYGLGALRIGWIVLGEALVAERAALRDMTFLGYVDPPTSSLRAAQAALRSLPELLAPLARVEAECRPLFWSWLRESEGIQAHVPDHGIIAFPRIVGVDDTLALAEFLQREVQVDAVPGEFFGAPGHLRLGCGLPRATLVEALERLERGIRAYRAQATG